MTRIALALVVGLVTLSGAPQERVNELEAVKLALPSFPGGRAEVSLWEDSRVDILTDTHAIEADWARKHHEGTGQALYYALLTHRSPGLLLLTRDLEADEQYILRAQVVCSRYEIRLWVYDVPKRRMMDP